ncbi:ATP-binding protein [Kribbella italica]|uniref:Type IV secretory pathway VirB4 component n=1 Tax=Kribbella italica TaxID=1540520 RepID=A0A7W9JEC5_9ACTN|nr:ATP-binding protein [Kribbella italica]MBB5840563.1 type IV secretory pathway VirB4 component [Kribbella italica]
MNRRDVASYEPSGLDRAARRASRKNTELLRADSPTSTVRERGTFEAFVEPARAPYDARHAIPLLVDSHRATTRILRAAYPFLAEGGLGADGTYIGSDIFSGGSFVYDPWVLYQAKVITNPNLLLAGVIGSGKSSTAKAFITRSIALGHRAYVPCDPKGEWTAVAEAVGGVAIQLGPGLPTRLNPLDAGTRPTAVLPDEWHKIVWSRRRALLGTLAESTLGRPMTAVEHTALDLALETASTDRPAPTIPDVVTALFAPDDDHARRVGLQTNSVLEDGREVAHAIRRLVHGDLSGMFDGPSTTEFDATLPMVSLDSSRIGSGGNDHALRLALACASSWMEAAVADPSGGQRFIVYDEGWRVMRDPALLRRMQEQWKLSRAWGVSNVLIIHRLSDLAAVGDLGSEARALAEGLLADCSTRIMLRQEPDQLARTATLLGLTDVEIATIAKLPKGRALWRLPDRSFVVQLVRHAREVELFDTDARM